MPKVEFEGTQYEVPEGLPHEQILELVQQERNVRAAERAKLAVPPGIPEEFPKVSPEKQLERDQLAAKLRLKEAGGAEGVASRIEELKEVLQTRPMNASVRQMLKRELKFWEMAQEIEE